MTQSCNICGSERFVDFKDRPHSRCAECDALDRNRLFYLYIEQLNLPQTAKVLHIAPERGIYQRLRTWLNPGCYFPVDLHPNHFKKHAKDCQKIDLCDLNDWASDSFDLILHSHVLEHTFCDISYSFFHLHRMLKTTGRHVFSVPFMPGRWAENTTPLTDENREKMFGQSDHTRVFGADDRNQHIGKIIRLPDGFDAEAEFSAARLKQHNIPIYMWHGYQPAMVLNIAKHDCLLSAN